MHPAAQSLIAKARLCGALSLTVLRDALAEAQVPRPRMTAMATITELERDGWRCPATGAWAPPKAAEGEADDRQLPLFEEVR